MHNGRFGGGSKEIGRGNLKGMVSCRGVWGSSPREFLVSGAACGALQCIFVVILPKHPSPKKLSLQIYTDLKNGPGSWTSDFSLKILSPEFDIAA